MKVENKDREKRIGGSRETLRAGAERPCGTSLHRPLSLSLSPGLSRASGTEVGRGGGERDEVCTGGRGEAGVRSICAVKSYCKQIMFSTS